MQHLVLPVDLRKIGVKQYCFRVLDTAVPIVVYKVK
jgi:hypothetical protein